jgi:hypothetical protein
MQSVPITTDVVSSNTVHGEMYLELIQHYMWTVIKFVSDNATATGRWFSPDTLASSNNKTDRHDIAEIMLKVALNPITMID